MLTLKILLIYYDRREQDMKLKHFTVQFVTCSLPAMCDLGICKVVNCSSMP